MKTTISAAAQRRERNRQEMREAILEAARRIVTEQGIEALTMRAVAGAIGYSAAALYEYFPAKEDLYGCLYFEGSGGFAGRMRDTLAALPVEATGQERMAAVGHAYRAFAHEQPDLFRLVLANAAPELSPGFDPRGTGSAKKGADGEDAFSLLVGVAREGIERGEFVETSPIAIAMAAWTLVHGFVMLELTGHLTSDIPPAQAIKEAASDGGSTLDDLFAATLRLGAVGVLRR